MVIAAVIIVNVAGSNPKGPPGPLTPAAPPHVASQARACTKVIEHLPLVLDKLKPRVVDTKPETSFVEAWGDPAVILRCGVNRPKSLRAGSSTRAFDSGLITGPYFFITGGSDANVWTSIDRAPYISVTIPGKYQGGSIMAPLGKAIAAALPAVCSTLDTAPVERLCTRRK